MIEPLFDFEKGEFVFERNGEVKLVTGKEELKNQINKVFHTALNRYEIYRGTGWGSGIESLIVGRKLPREYIKAEVERCIRDSLKNLYGVNHIGAFEISQTGSKLKIYFKIYSIFGDIDYEEDLMYG